jgi:hypothetical protein
MKTWRPGEDDESDIAIDREWRKASREEPGPHVDAAILAAARTRRPLFATWQALAAAATVAGLAFLLVQLLPRERELEQPIRMESPQPAAVPTGQTGAAASATTESASEGAAAAPRVPAAAPRLREDEPAERDQSAPKSAVAPSQEPAEAAASRSEAALEPRQSSRGSLVHGELAAGATAPSAAPERAAAKADSSSLASPTPEMPPAQWATLIETLYASGDLAAAVAQLRAFRTEHPNADRYLPKALLEWASTVE